MLLMEWLSARTPCFALANAGDLLAAAPIQPLQDIQPLHAASTADGSMMPGGAALAHAGAALAPDDDAHTRWDAGSVLIFSYLSLKLIWLKFLLIWRFFRAWALLDGRTPPENLPRCMSNHHSVLGFWRCMPTPTSARRFHSLSPPTRRRHPSLRAPRAVSAHCAPLPDLPPAAPLTAPAPVRVRAPAHGTPPFRTGSSRTSTCRSVAGTTACATCSSSSYLSPSGTASSSA